MMCTTVLHGGALHRTSTPHKSGNKINEKKIDIYLNVMSSNVQLIVEKLQAMTGIYTHTRMLMYAFLLNICLFRPYLHYG